MYMCTYMQTCVCVCVIVDELVHMHMNTCMYAYVYMYISSLSLSLSLWFVLLGSLSLSLCLPLSVDEEEDLVQYWDELSTTDWFRQHPILSAARLQTKFRYSLRGSRAWFIETFRFLECSIPRLLTPDFVSRCGYMEMGQSLPDTWLNRLTLWQR